MQCSLIKTFTASLVDTALALVPVALAQIGRIKDAVTLRSNSCILLVTGHAGTDPAELDLPARAFPAD